MVYLCYLRKPYVKNYKRENDEDFPAVKVMTDYGNFLRLRERSSILKIKRLDPVHSSAHSLQNNYNFQNGKTKTNEKTRCYR